MKLKWRPRFWIEHLISKYPKYEMIFIALAAFIDVFFVVIILIVVAHGSHCICDCSSYVMNITGSNINFTAIP